jgi:opine dehydrogenase
MTVPGRAVLVVGDDDGALLVAAWLASVGHQVVLWEPPAGGARPAGAQTPAVLRLGTADGDAVASLALVTSDIFEALAAADVVVTCAPPHAQQAFADGVLPLVEPRHLLVLLCGALGSLACAKWLRDRGRWELPTLAESDTMPVVGTSVGPDRLRLDAVASRPGFGVFPAVRTGAARDALVDLFPGARPHAHVAAAALAGVERFLRAPALLMNAGLWERARRPFAPFADGFTPEIARVADVLDGERRALAGALGLDLPPAAEALRECGLSPGGDLWAAVHGSFALMRPPGDGVPPADLLADDVSFGLRPWVELAGALDVRMPVARALLALHDAAGPSSGVTGWSLDDLGLVGLTGDALQRFLISGTDEPEA